MMTMRRPSSRQQPLVLCRPSRKGARFVLFISAWLAVAGSVCAQPHYPPPPGWEFVKSLDSTVGFALRVVGDTAVLQVSSVFGLRSDSLSTDGGRTWGAFPRYDSNAFWSGMFPHSISFFTLRGTGNGMMNFRSSSGFNTWSDHLMDSTTIASMSALKEVYIDPVDDRGIFFRTSVGQQAYREESIWRSRDGGFTWVKLPLPMPRNGAGVMYEICFDVRRRGLWYVSVQGTYEGTYTDYYKTDDDGVTFARMPYAGLAWGGPLGYNWLKLWSGYSGISAPGVLRGWIKRLDGAGMEYRGVAEIGPDPADTVQRVRPWLSLFDTTIPFSNHDSGWYKSIIPENCSFYSRDPLHQFLQEYGSRWNPLDSVLSMCKSHLYETTNDGETWKSLWESSISPFIELATLDEATNTLWVIATDTAPPNLKDYSATRHCIFRYRLPDQVYDSGSNLVPQSIRISSISPQPADHQVDVNLSIPSADRVHLFLVDELGRAVRVIFDGWMSAGEQSLRWTIPGTVRSGSYRVVARTRRGVASRAQIICR
jgi:hypothetical protein